MNKGRLEAFSDGVLAIIITIMVLELKVPHDSSIHAIIELLPVFMSYLLSFVYVGIYWNNHHHMMQLVKKVNGKVLWANLHLLFWLSLFPFATAWMGENHYDTIPVVLYGCVMLMAALAYFILEHTLLRLHGPDSDFASTFSSRAKDIVSIILNVVAIGGSFITPYVGITCYVLVAVIWFIPEKRVEKKLA